MWPGARCLNCPKPDMAMRLHMDQTGDFTWTITAPDQSGQWNLSVWVDAPRANSYMGFLITVTDPDDMGYTAEHIGTWVGPDGEPASEEEITVYQGLRHCGWESALFLSVGWPLGTTAATAENSHQYLRDPDYVVPYVERLRTDLDLDTDLPADASFSGYRTDTVELWLAPSDQDDAAYLVYPDHVERWPRAEPAIGCA